MTMTFPAPRTPCVRLTLKPNRQCACSKNPFRVHACTGMQVTLRWAPIAPERTADCPLLLPRLHANMVLAPPPPSPLLPRPGRPHV